MKLTALEEVTKLVRFMPYKMFKDSVRDGIDAAVFDSISENVRGMIYGSLGPIARQVDFVSNTLHRTL